MKFPRYLSKSWGVTKRVGLQCLFSLIPFLVVFFSAPPAEGYTGLVSTTATVDGVTIHYTIGGTGAPLLLLHGYAETSHMWNPVLPALGERFTVVAPDLPGIGESSIPDSGLDMKNAAIRIHSLVRSLGMQKVSVVGHDIGLMVAYAYAAQFPSEVEKLVVMDAFLPGVGDWRNYYDDPHMWHFRFNGPTPEALVEGRERVYFEHYWNDFAADKTRSIPEADRQRYAAAYARPGRMRAGWAYFVSFQQAAEDFAGFAQTKLSMPVLSLAGEKSAGDFLGRQMKLVASNVTSLVLRNTGHWMMEENPEETAAALEKFLSD
jgi:pimeloyl-ACP methyl ester carboxylesterase